MSNLQAAQSHKTIYFVVITRAFVKKKKKTQQNPSGIKNTFNIFFLKFFLLSVAV